ncbi:MAG TPA: hypothetical protein VD993_00100 [Chitinophagaceae bacterium]|nr:hypothetical protein [Chitinophagaceae bacterium]
MQTTAFPGRKFPLLVVFFLLVIFQSCKKTEPIAEAATNNEEISGRKKKDPPPPPPPPFYFNNCSYPVFSGTFTAGVPANITFTLNYINSPGGSYPAFTSSTVNGITITAPAGTLNTGSGSIVFTATGTPASPGFCAISVGVGGIIPCALNITVLNPPADPATCGGDPGPTVGSTGCVTFTYRGQTVTYSTVRAADGKIWLRQNLGSPQVAMSVHDQASFGHFFQWGRWDDGHQLPNSPTITGSATFQNPSHIAGGNPNFITGTASSTAWWNTGSSADTWSGNTASATNGKNPCAALGAGWRVPTITDWQNVVNTEFITSAADAFQSNLKLPAAGYKHAFNGSVFGFVGGNYFSSTAGNNGTAHYFSYDTDNYQVFFSAVPRGYGMSCRCVKD